jgi:hypothetical protein
VAPHPQIGYRNENAKSQGNVVFAMVEVENAVSRSPLRHSHPAGASNGDST